MNKLKRQLLLHKGLLIVAGLLVIGGLAFAFDGGTPKVVVEGNYIESPSEQNLGSVTSNVVNSQDFTINGWRDEYLQMPMRTATTTLCTIKTPNNATTTLTGFKFSILSATSSAATLFLATSTNEIGTSSANGYAFIATTTVTALTAKNWAWFPTVREPVAVNPNASQEQLMLYPDQYLILGAQPSSYTTGFTFTGNCYAKFSDF